MIVFWGILIILKKLRLKSLDAVAIKKLFIYLFIYSLIDWWRGFLMGKEKWCVDIIDGKFGFLCDMGRKW